MKAFFANPGPCRVCGRPSVMHGYCGSCLAKRPMGRVRQSYMRTNMMDRRYRE